MSKTYTVLGIMSGSSLDGVDLALCEFTINKSGKWTFRIEASETIPYNKTWLHALKKSHKLSGDELVQLHHRYGRFLGSISKEFLEQRHLTADFISSHGHTLFHQPEKGYTFQIGEGQSIATSSQLAVICDYRTKDVSLGGQGAPLVPIGDEILFAGYDVCLNIGGIANISFKKKNLRVAFDVCPANQLLNALSREVGNQFDRDGLMARSGTVDGTLMDRLNKDPYYAVPYPKSLSNEYVIRNFLALLEDPKLSTQVKLRTVTEHIAGRIAGSIRNLNPGNVLVTGGGAHNKYLVESFSALSDHQFIIPDRMLIDFKEALVFAFMGVLRIRNEFNCLSSVTGARKDSCSGIIFHP